MKTTLRKLFLVIFCLSASWQLLHAQETTDNATYYYNNFETAVAGTTSSLGVTAFRSTAAVTIDASTASPLETSKSLSSITPPANSIGAIRWNFVGNGTGNIDMTQNDWEWNFLYKNTTTSSNDDPDVMTVGKNEWKYWLVANGYNGNTTQGFYVSHVGTNLVLRYRYDNVAGSGRYNTMLTTALPNDQNTYIIKVQRLKNGSWAFYKDLYVAGMTTAKTLAVYSTGTTGSSFSTYYYSYLESTCTTSNRFKWDKFDMYTRVLQFTAVGANSTANGITPIPYYANENAIIYGLKIIARGNFNINQIYITTTGAQLNSYFNSTGQLYRSTDAFYNTSTDVNVSSIQLTGTTAYAGSAINDFITSSGNTDGTYSVPGYYFISATTSSPLNYGNPIGTDNIIFSGVTGLAGESVSPSTVSYTSTSSTGNTITFLNSNDWKGGTSTNWSTGSNWSGGHVPTTSESARIGVVAYTNTLNQPALTATVSVGQLVFGSTQAVKVTMASNNLTSNYGIILNASANVTITGSGSVTANNSGSSSSIMASTSILTMNGNANLVNNGTFTLMADASSSAAIGPSTGASTISGTFNVQRYFTANRNYRFLSSPVYTSSQTLGASTGKVYNLSYFSGTTSSLPITTGLSGGGFDKVGNPTIYLFREDRNINNNVFTGGNYIGVSNITGESLNYVNYNNTTTSGYLPVGNGFAFFYRGTKSAVSYRTTFPNPGLPDNTTVTSPGSLNQGSIPVVLWYNTSTANSYQTTLSYSTVNTASTGYNLVGNPYPCTIDWEQFSTSNSSAGIYAQASSFLGIYTSNYVSSTIYTFNPLTSNFDTYTIGGANTGSGSRYLASWQGFFVKVMPTILGSVGNTSITFNEAAKASTNQITTFLGTPKTEAVQGLRLKLAADSVHTDDILMYFKSDGSTNYLPTMDATDLGGISPKVSLSGIDKNGVLMAFKNLPPVSDTLSVKLYVNASATGNAYTLTGSGFESMDWRYDVFLVDHYRNDSLLMNAYKTYHLDIDKNVPASFGTDRFQLVFHKKILPPYALLNIAGTKVQQGAQINWKVDNEASYTKFDLEKQGADQQFASIYLKQSDSSASYSFIDTKPVIGNNIYRLKQTDPFGNISYSPLVPVYYADQSNKLAKSNINLYPNPATSTINLTIATGVANTSASYNIQIANSSGLMIKQATSTQPSWQGYVSDLAPGTYVLKVINKKDGGMVGESKFVKL